MISPKEARKITDEELEIVSKLESELDEVILNNSKNNLTYHSLEVPSNLGKVGHRVLDKIEKMYSNDYQVQIDCTKSPTYIFFGTKRIN